MLLGRNTSCYFRQGSNGYISVGGYYKWLAEVLGHTMLHSLRFLRWYVDQFFFLIEGLGDNSIYKSAASHVVSLIPSSDVCQSDNMLLSQFWVSV